VGDLGGHTSHESVAERPRCHIYFPEGHIGVSPTVIGLIRALAAAGFQVTAYGTVNSYPTVGHLPENVDLVWLPEAGRWLKAIRGITIRGAWRLRQLAPLLESLTFTGRVCLRRLSDRQRGPRGASVAIGINCDGAIAAHVTAWLLGEPYMFLSLELARKPADYQWIGAPWRWVALRSLSGARGLIIQGLDRVEILTRQYGRKPTRILFLPNSAGPSKEGVGPQENFFRKKFALGGDVSIALQAGMVDEAACSLSLANAFSQIADWALVFHERRERSLDEPYIRKLHSVNTRNLYLSLEPVPFDRLGEIIEAATVGLVFYAPDSSNDEGLRAVTSSGKLALYLRYGKPVLVNRLPALVEVVEAFDCGVVIEKPSDSREFEAALHRIAAAYSEYSRNARRCYEERFDFEKSVAQLVDALKQIANEA
jgi:glycosyltransferase involved in cell wall biosynthesis